MCAGGRGGGMLPFQTEQLGSALVMRSWRRGLKEAASPAHLGGRTFHAPWQVKEKTLS